MEKLGEDEEKTTEEASNSTEDTRSDKEDKRIRDIIADRVDLVESLEEGSTGPSKSQTVTSKYPDFNESDMEDEEKVLEFFRRNSGLIPEVAEKNNFPYLNNSEGMVLQFQEDTPEILEGIKSPSVSNEDTEDSSSNSDLDFSLSRYYFDGSLPVSAHVEESETHQDETPVHFSDASTVPQATYAATNFMEKLLRTPRASSGY